MFFLIFNVKVVMTSDGMKIKARIKDLLTYEVSQVSERMLIDYHLLKKRFSLACQMTHC